MDAALLLRVDQTLVGVVGVFGNGLVCLVIYRVSSMHTTTNAFIFNQAAIDLFGSLVMAVRNNMPDLLGVNIPGGIAGFLLCRVYNAYAVQFSLFTASTYNLMTVTLERYIAIVYPYTYPKIFGKRKAVGAFLAAGWVLGFVVSCGAAVVIYHQNGYCARASGVGALGVAVVMLNFFIPSLVMLVSYMHITIVLKRSADRVAPGLATLTRPAADQENQEGTAPTTGTAAGTSQPETQGESLLRARRNTFKTLLLVFVVFVICWLPHSTIFLVFDLGGSVQFSGILFYFGAFTLTANVCVNPFIYAVKYKQFRAGFRRMVGLQTVAGE